MDSRQSMQAREHGIRAHDTRGKHKNYEISQNVFLFCLLCDILWLAGYPENGMFMSVNDPHGKPSAAVTVKRKDTVCKYC